MATVRYSDVEQLADDHGQRLRQHSVEPLAANLQTDRMRHMLMSATKSPESVFGNGWAAHALEAGVTSLVSEGRACSTRRLDSRSIVREAIDFVEDTRHYRPTMGELCGATNTSESRVRQAFVELFDAPPTLYFRRRLLDRLRNDLLHTDPTSGSVTGVATSLGVTQFGRVAGRYQSTFDELPSETLKRRPPRHAAAQL